MAVWLWVLFVTFALVGHRRGEIVSTCNVIIVLRSVRFIRQSAMCVHFCSIFLLYCCMHKHLPSLVFVCVIRLYSVVYTNIEHERGTNKNKNECIYYILFVPRCLVRNCVCSLPRVIISLSASLASLLVHNSHSLASFSSAPLFDTILYCTIVDQHVFDTTELFCAASVRAPQCVCIHLLLSQHTDPCGRLHGSQTNRSTAHIHKHI